MKREDTSLSLRGGDAKHRERKGCPALHGGGVVPQNHRHAHERGNPEKIA